MYDSQLVLPLDTRKMCESFACFIRLTINCQTNEGNLRNVIQFLLTLKNYHLHFVPIFLTLISYLQSLDLSSIWALLAAFEDPVPVPSAESAFPFEGAFVKGVDSLSWMANNTKKLLSSQDTGLECWTFLSTATFGKQNKVPQVS